MGLLVLFTFVTRYFWYYVLMVLVVLLLYTFGTWELGVSSISNAAGLVLVFPGWQISALESC